MLAALALAGCGATVEDTFVPQGQAIPGRTINGNVHGGVYPIRGATIKLMQTVTVANNTKNSSGTYITPGNTYGAAAYTLLTTSSDQNGYFTFPDTGWTCAANEFAYIVVTGGHTANLNTVATNSNVVQVGAIGSCSELANQSEIDAVNVFVSELSTVAAAAALGNFINVVDPADGTADQVVNIGAPLKNSFTGSCSGTGSGMSCKAAGLAHAFTNAVTLVDSVRTTGAFPTGQAQGCLGLVSNCYQSNPLIYSAIPAALINTIGDILQQCVDSAGVPTVAPTQSNPTTPTTPTSASTACSTLFTNAKPPSATGLAAPNNTLQVALDMMKYPTNNISGLFGTVAPTVPFTPTLASAPTSFAISIFYGVSFNGSTGGSLVPYPVDIALDSADDAFVLYTNSAGGLGNPTGVAEWMANGTLVSGGNTTGNYTYPNQIALDASGNVYTTNNYSGNTASDAVLRLSGGNLVEVASDTGAAGIAGDRSGNIFVSSQTLGQSSISEFTGGSLSLALFTAIGGKSLTPASAAASSALAGAAFGVAVDAGQNVWGAAQNINGIAGAVDWINTGSASAPTYSAGGGNDFKAFSSAKPFSVAVNASSAAYFPTQGEMNSATFSGGVLTAHTNIAITGTSNVPHRSQVDGSGNVFWTDLEGGGLLNMYNPTNGSLISFLPCFTYPNGSSYSCITTTTSASNPFTPSNLRALAIDSAGDIWYAADAGDGAVIETLGLASPTWPLLSYGYPGCKPGAGTVFPNPVCP